MSGETTRGVALMPLPNLSNSMAVGRLRHIQTLHESGECRNPDTLVRRFLPFNERWRTRLLGGKELRRLRSDPFYYYLVARTRHYDALLLDEVAADIRQLVNIGCGSDTRAFRFERALRDARVPVLECDQRESVLAKQRLTAAWRPAPAIEYQALDLNDHTWPEFEEWLAGNGDRRALVLIEGVSPYIDAEAFPRFLSLLAARLPNGSRVAYDFKQCGADDQFGRSGRTRNPFRLPQEREALAAFHENLGYELEQAQTSDELCRHMLRQLALGGTPLYSEDGLLGLRVSRQ
jgi:methyltransferase (TIGR00027 family)